jgi:hypothetical protein
MRAHVQLTPAEKKAMSRLTPEEREAVIERMMERIREDLEWVLTVEFANKAAAEAPRLAKRAELHSVPPPVPKDAGPAEQRYRWPSAPLRRAR